VFIGAVHVTVAEALLAVAATFVGGSGAVVCMTDFVPALDVPIAFVAFTEKV
jgi:hypothetical protein